MPNPNVEYDRLDESGLLYYSSLVKTAINTVSTTLDGKVDKVTGKGLSTNDYTTAEKEKLAAIGTVMTYKGTVATVSELPQRGNVAGDTWNVTENGHNYCWDGSTFDDLGGSIDLSGYVQASEMVALTNAQILACWNDAPILSNN